MADFTTESGKKVKLQPITLQQRIECEDASSIGYSGDGGIVVYNVAKAGLKWCSAGTGLSITELDKQGYTYNDIMQIGNEVKRLASLDPTKESDSS